MNFLQLQYVSMIFEEGSISSAARKLYVSQPSLSQMLHNVEKELGIELCLRDGTRMTATCAGERFYQHASKLLLEYKNLFLEMDGIKNCVQGRLSIGIPVSRGAYILPSLLPRIRKAYPELEILTIENTVKNLEIQLFQGKIDFVFSHYRDNHPNLTYLPIVTEEWLLAVPRNHYLSAPVTEIADWRTRSPLSLHQVGDEPFILLREGHGAREFADQVFRNAGITPKIVIETHSNHVAHSLAAAGMGLTMLPEHEVLFRCLPQPCVYFSIEDRQYFRTLCLCHHKDLAQTRPMKQIIELILSTVKGIYEMADLPVLPNSRAPESER